MLENSRTKTWIISAFKMSEGDSILIETLLKLEEDCLKFEEDEDNSFESEDRENSSKRSFSSNIKVWYSWLKLIES